MHDLKLVWSFMRNGFVASPFQRYFPDLPILPPDDVLPSTLHPYPIRPVRDIEIVLEETLTKLSYPSRPALLPSRRTTDGTPPAAAEHSIDSMPSSGAASDNSVDSSLALPPSVDATPTRAYRAWSTDDSRSRETAEEKKEAEDAIMGHMEEEAWVWANTLLAQCETVIKQALEGKDIRSEDGGAVPGRFDPSGDSLYDERCIDDVGFESLTISVQLIANKGLWTAYVSASEADSQYRKSAATWFRLFR